MSMESVRVYLTSATGLGVAGVDPNWFVDVGEPVVAFLLQLGQLGVAVATIVYIYLKCRALAKSKKPKKNL